jgi:hypothetical protein
MIGLQFFYAGLFPFQPQQIQGDTVRLAETVGNLSGENLTRLVEVARVAGGAGGGEDTIGEAREGVKASDPKEAENWQYVAQVRARGRVAGGMRLRWRFRDEESFRVRERILEERGRR